MLARGIGRGAGVEGAMPSPTFTLMQPYTGKYPFYHFDLYRLEDGDEFWQAGLEEYIASDVCPERIDKPPVRPYDQPKYSFYPQWDDHINTFAEEYARMPEGYPIKLGGKHTDY